MLHCLVESTLVTAACVRCSSKRTSSKTACHRPDAAQPYVLAAGTPGRRAPPHPVRGTHPSRSHVSPSPSHATSHQDPRGTIMLLAHSPVHHSPAHPYSHHKPITTHPHPTTTHAPHTHHSCRHSDDSSLHALPEHSKAYQTPPDPPRSSPPRFQNVGPDVACSNRPPAVAAETAVLADECTQATHRRRLKTRTGNHVNKEQHRGSTANVAKSRDQQGRVQDLERLVSTSDGWPRGRTSDRHEYATSSSAWHGSMSSQGVNGALQQLDASLVDAANGAVPSWGALVGASERKSKRVRRTVGKDEQRLEDSVARSRSSSPSKPAGFARVTTSQPKGTAAEYMHSSSRHGRESQPIMRDYHTNEAVFLYTDDAVQCTAGGTQLRRNPTSKLRATGESVKGNVEGKVPDVMTRCQAIHSDPYFSDESKAYSAIPDGSVGHNLVDELSRQAIIGELHYLRERKQQYGEESKQESRGESERQFERESNQRHERESWLSSDEDVIHKPSGYLSEVPQRPNSGTVGTVTDPKYGKTTVGPAEVDQNAGGDINQHVPAASTHVEVRNDPLRNDRQRKGRNRVCRSPQVTHTDAGSDTGSHSEAYVSRVLAEQQQQQLLLHDRQPTAGGMASSESLVGTQQVYSRPPGGLPLPRTGRQRAAAGYGRWDAEKCAPLSKGCERVGPNPGPQPGAAFRGHQQAQLHPLVLTRHIATAQSWVQLRSQINRNYRSFDHIHVTAAVGRMTKVLKRGAAEQDDVLATLKLLCSCLPPFLNRLALQELCTLFWSFGFLRFTPPPALLPQLLHRFQQEAALQLPVSCEVTARAAGALRSISNVLFPASEDMAPTASPPPSIVSLIHSTWNIIISALQTLSPEELSRFNPNQLCHLLASLSQAQADPRLLTSITHALQPALLAGAHNVNTTTLSDLLTNGPSIPASVPEFSSSLARVISSRLHSCTVRELTAVATACAHAADIDQQLLLVLPTVLYTRAAELDARGVANCAWAVASISRSHSLTQSTVSSTASTAGTAVHHMGGTADHEVQHHAPLMRAANGQPTFVTEHAVFFEGRLSGSPVGDVSRPSRVVASSTTNNSHGEEQNCGPGVGDGVCVGWSDVLQRLCMVASRKLPHMKPRHMSMLCWAVATMDLYDPSVMQAVAQQLLSNKLALKGLSPQGIANISWAYSHLRHKDPVLFQALAQEAALQLPQFKPLELCSLVYALAESGSTHVPLLKAVDNMLLDTLRAAAKQVAEASRKLANEQQQVLGADAQVHRQLVDSSSENNRKHPNEPQESVSGSLSGDEQSDRQSRKDMRELGVCKERDRRAPAGGPGDVGEWSSKLSELAGRFTWPQLCVVAWAFDKLNFKHAVLPSLMIQLLQGAATPGSAEGLGALSVAHSMAQLRNVESLGDVQQSTAGVTEVKTSSAADSSCMGVPVRHVETGIEPWRNEFVSGDIFSNGERNVLPYRESSVSTEPWEQLLKEMFSSCVQAVIEQQAPNTYTPRALQSFVLAESGVTYAQPSRSHSNPLTHPASGSNPLSASYGSGLPATSLPAASNSMLLNRQPGHQPSVIPKYNRDCSGSDSRQLDTCNAHTDVHCDSHKQAGADSRDHSSRTSSSTGTRSTSGSTRSGTVAGTGRRGDHGRECPPLRFKLIEPSDFCAEEVVHTSDPSIGPGTWDREQMQLAGLMDCLNLPHAGQLLMEGRIVGGDDNMDLDNTNLLDYSAGKQTMHLEPPHTREKGLQPVPDAQHVVGGFAKAHTREEESVVFCSDREHCGDGPVSGASASWPSNTAVSHMTDMSPEGGQQGSSQQWAAAGVAPGTMLSLFHAGAIKGTTTCDELLLIVKTHIHSMGLGNVVQAARQAAALCVQQQARHAHASQPQKDATAFIQQDGEAVPAVTEGAGSSMEEDSVNYRLQSSRQRVVCWEQDNSVTSPRTQMRDLSENGCFGEQEQHVWHNMQGAEVDRKGDESYSGARCSPEVENECASLGAAHSVMDAISAHLLRSKALMRRLSAAQICTLLSAGISVSYSWRPILLIQLLQQLLQKRRPRASIHHAPSTTTPSSTPSGDPNHDKYLEQEPLSCATDTMEPSSPSPLSSMYASIDPAPCIERKRDATLTSISSPGNNNDGVPPRPRHHAAGRAQVSTCSVVEERMRPATMAPSTSSQSSSSQSTSSSTAAAATALSDCPGPTGVARDTSGAQTDNADSSPVRLLSLAGPAVLAHLACALHQQRRKLVSTQGHHVSYGSAPTTITTLDSMTPGSGVQESAACAAFDPGLLLSMDHLSYSDPMSLSRPSRPGITPTSSQAPQSHPNVTLSDTSSDRSEDTANSPASSTSLRSQGSGGQGGSQPPPHPLTVIQPSPYTVTESPPDTHRASQQSPYMHTETQPSPHTHTASRPSPYPHTETQPSSHRHAATQSLPHTHTASQPSPQPHTATQSSPQPHTASQAAQIHALLDSTLAYIHKQAISKLPLFAPKHAFRLLMAYSHSSTCPPDLTAAVANWGKHRFHTWEPRDITCLCMALARCVNQKPTRAYSGEVHASVLTGTLTTTLTGTSAGTLTSTLTGTRPNPVTGTQHWTARVVTPGAELSDTQSTAQLLQSQLHTLGKMQQQNMSSSSSSAPSYDLPDEYRTHAVIMGGIQQQQVSSSSPSRASPPLDPMHNSNLLPPNTAASHHTLLTTALNVNSVLPRFAFGSRRPAFVFACARDHITPATPRSTTQHSPKSSRKALSHLSTVSSRHGQTLTSVLSVNKTSWAASVRKTGSRQVRGSTLTLSPCTAPAKPQADVVFSDWRPVYAESQAAEMGMELAGCHDTLGRVFDGSAVNERAISKSGKQRDQSTGSEVRTVSSYDAQANIRVSSSPYANRHMPHQDSDHTPSGRQVLQEGSHRTSAHIQDPSRAPSAHTTGFQQYELVTSSSSSSSTAAAAAPRTFRSPTARSLLSSSGEFAGGSDAGECTSGPGVKQRVAARGEVTGDADECSGRRGVQQRVEACGEVKAFMHAVVSGVGRNWMVEFSLRDLVCLTQAAAGVLRQQLPGRFLEDVLCVLTAHVDHMPARDLSCLLWATAAAEGQVEDSFLEAAAQRAAQLAPHFAPVGLSNTLWALGRLRLGDSLLVFVPPLLHQARIMIPRFTPRELSSVLWAAARLQEYDAVFMQDATHAVQAQSATMGNQELAVCSWALAKLRHHHPPAMRALAAAASRRLPHMLPCEVACMAHALQALNIHHPTFFTTMSHTLPSQLPAFTEQGLAMVLNACATQLAQCYSASLQQQEHRREPTVSIPVDTTGSVMLDMLGVYGQDLLQVMSCVVGELGTRSTSSLNAETCLLLYPALLLYRRLSVTGVLPADVLFEHCRSTWLLASRSTAQSTAAEIVDALLVVTHRPGMMDAVEFGGADSADVPVRDTFVPIVTHCTVTLSTHQLHSHDESASVLCPACLGCNTVSLRLAHSERERVTVNVAVEVTGPDQYSRSPSSTAQVASLGGGTAMCGARKNEMGSLILRRALLMLAGFDVLTVPLDEWQALVSQECRDVYLQKKMTTLLSRSPALQNH